MSPVHERMKVTSFLRRDTFIKLFGMFMVFGIEAIITKHFEMFFRYMNDKSFDKIDCRNAFSYSFIIFVSSIMKGYKVTIVIINTRSCNYRSTEIAADIFDGSVRITKIGLGTNIKTISMLFVDFIFNFREMFAEFFGKLFEKNFAKSITKKSIIKMFNDSPDRMVASSALRDKSMDVRIPF